MYALTDKEGDLVGMYRSRLKASKFAEQIGAIMHTVSVDLTGPEGKFPGILPESILNDREIVVS